MKSILKYFVPMTAAVVALASCNKEKDNKVETPKAPALHITVTATPDELQGDADVEADSKTYIDNKTIKWGTGEYMKIGVFDGSETVFGDSSSESADSGNGSVTHSFSFDITPATASGDYTYYGLYPLSAASTSNNTNPASYKVILPASQSATAASYDPKAYILVAKPESGKTVTNPNWNAWFRRATALNKVTLTNLPEDIKRVKITAPDGKYLAGGRYVNLTTGYSGEIYNGGGRTETVEVRFASKQSHESPIIVWFTSWDAEILVGSNLTIVAYSDAHTYTRTLTVVNKSITFKEGYLNTLNVNMATAVEGDNTELDEGDYVILAKNNATYYALKGEATGTRLVSVDYTGSLDSYAGTGDIVWSVAASGGSYTVKNGTNYLGWTSGNAASLISEENYSDATCLMDITYENSTYLLSVKNDSSRKLARNTSNQYFAFYSGTQYKDLVFVPATIDNRDEVTLSFENSSIDKTTANYSEFHGQTATASPNESAITDKITYAISGDNIGTVTEATGAVTLNGSTGSATITASFAGDANYRAAEASYTINVTSADQTGWIETALTDITSDDVFVIVGNNGSNYAMNHTSLNSSGAPLVTAITVNGNKLASDPSAEIKWNLSSDANGYMFYPDGVTNKWLNLIANNNGLRVSSTAANGKYWSLDASGYLKGTDPNSDTRYIGIYNSTDWRSYTSNGGNIANQTFKFYKYVAAPDTREEAGMSWSAEEATATYTTGNSLSFSAPTLTPGNATDITYESTDGAIATVAADGTVTITALNGNVVTESSTTIKAIFEGDDDYKPQTVSYILNVVDSRDPVATPTFSPAGGNYTSAQNVTISCTTEDATIHYTNDGSAPTTASPVYSSAILVSSTTTIKAIATKTGYKNSNIGTATYTIEGAAESLPFSETFASSIGTFTIDEKSNPDSVPNIWKFNSSSMQASSYYNKGQHAAESWLVSPYVDLTGVNSSTHKVEFTFDEKINTYFNDAVTEATVWVKTKNASPVQIAYTHPAAGSYGTITLDLSSYIDNEVQVIFKYIGSSVSSGTWNVKNVSIAAVALPAHEITVNGEESPLTVELNGDATKTTILTVASNYTWNITATTGSPANFTYVKDSDTQITITPATDNTTGSKKEGIGSMTLSDGTVTFTINFDQANKESGGGGDTHYYVKVTDLSTLSAGDKILLINTNHDALPAFTSTGTLSPTDLHTSKYDSTNDRFPTNDATVDNCAITLVAPTTAINNKVVFKLKMSNNYYIVKTGTSGTGFNPNTSSTAASGDWTLSADNNGRVNIKNNLENSSRCIIWRSGDQNKFGAYASSNINNTEYYNVNIYKLN